MIYLNFSTVTIQALFKAASMAIHAVAVKPVAHTVAIYDRFPGTPSMWQFLKQSFTLEFHIILLPFPCAQILLDPVDAPMYCSDIVS